MWGFTKLWTFLAWLQKNSCFSSTESVMHALSVLIFYSSFYHTPYNLYYTAPNFLKLNDSSLTFRLALTDYLDYLYD